MLLAWAVEDKVFPFANAKKYAAEMPNARIEEIADSFSLTPEDQPERLSGLIAAFVADMGMAKDLRGARQAK